MRVGYGLYRFLSYNVSRFDKVNRWVILWSKDSVVSHKFCPNKITLEKIHSNAIHVGKSQ
jgi:hypothetical protein